MVFDLRARLLADQDLWHGQLPITINYVRDTITSESNVVALRRAITQTDVMSFGPSKVYREGCTFSIPATDERVRPLPGDEIVDGVGTWTVLDCALLGLGTRFQVSTRRWVLGETLNLYRALATTQSVDGSKVISWSAPVVVNCGIIQDTSFIDDEASRRIFNTRYRVLLESSVSFNHGDKFVDSQGNEFFILEWENEDRTDELQVVTVDRTP